MCPSHATQRRQLPTRVSNACDRCRRNKSRCDPFRPCSLCVRASTECSDRAGASPARATKRRRFSPTTRASSGVESEVPREEADAQVEQVVDQPAQYEAPGCEEGNQPSIADREADSAMGIAQRIYQLGRHLPLDRTTSAFPGGGMYIRNPGTRSDGSQRRPIESILGYALPQTHLMHILLDEYFDSVHWFSLVIYEPRFRPALESVQDGHAYPAQKTFLLLLSTVLGMGAWYISHRNRADIDFPEEDWRNWSLIMLQGAERRLTELMDQTSVAAVQTCTLLGSYFVYHGKPNLSFALLGATIRTAQAIGLHRQPLHGDEASMEERKRVWWTIYTWDRFASVTYGRPLGINDKDCNVSHPVDVYEKRFFKPSIPSSGATSMCYSSYQRELNKLYLIASPLIEVIFGMRSLPSNDSAGGQHYMDQIMEVTERVQAWRQQLPHHLRLNLSSDCELNQPHENPIHQLQALALQLTFDSLLIIFYRPLLAQQVDDLIHNQPESTQGQASSPAVLSDTISSPFLSTSRTIPSSRPRVSSTEEWWAAALRTSRITEMPQLAQQATDSHLVAFLAINLFNSAIVMTVLALSDPLSDRAQQVKRTITRIYRLQELLGKRTQLSVQSNFVLKDVIHMLLRREADAMLAPVVPGGDLATNDGSIVAGLETPLISVEETLRLPIQLPQGTANDHSTKRGCRTTDRALRLNESLASVQKAFTSGFDDVGRDSAINIHGWVQDRDHAGDSQQRVTQDSPQPSVQSFLGYADQSWDNNTFVDATGNGLYWFWDTIWNEPQS